MDDFSEAELDLYHWTETYGVDLLQSCYLKLTLGIATSDEQIRMGEFIDHLRNILVEFGESDV